jgi:hypothetical protein
MVGIKPQDILVALKLCCIGGDEWSFTRLGKSLFISVGAAHNAVEHLRSAGLVFERAGEAVVARKKLFEFLVHGVPVFFYPVRGGIGKGMPTGFHAPPLLAELGKLGDAVGGAPAVPTVWPLPGGKVSGETLEPIYNTVPRAAAADSELYEYLAIVDGMRVGKTRGKKIAIDVLEAKILATKVPSAKEAVE